MKALLITILIMSGIRSQAQTTYDRKQDKRADTLSFSVTKMLALIQLQDEKIRALESRFQTFENGMVKSNQIVGYKPIVVRDSTATIKIIEYIKP